MKEFVGRRAKPWVYLIDDDGEHKKTRETKKMCNKKKCSSLLIIQIAY